VDMQPVPYNSLHRAPPQGEYTRRLTHTGGRVNG
jgi:hypothetical protein